MKRLFALVFCLLTSMSALAAPITLNFSASGFVNGGTQIPGFAGPISGSFSWDGALGDPISAFTVVSFTLYGHSFTLGEIGIANQGATQTAFGALVRGANAVVGDGAFTDFLFVFDRFSGEINSIAYSLEGKNGAIWWTPTQVDSSIRVGNGVPEPATLALLALAALGLGVARQRKQ